MSKPANARHVWRPHRVSRHRATVSKVRNEQAVNPQGLSRNSRMGKRQARIFGKEGGWEICGVGSKSYESRGAGSAFKMIFLVDTVG